VRAIALTDFGSTCTRLSLVDPEAGRLLSWSEAPTSIGTDLMDGYAEPLDAALREDGRRGLDRGRGDLDQAAIGQAVSLRSGDSKWIQKTPRKRTGGNA
jgi:hypothetical protein